MKRVYKLIGVLLSIAIISLIFGCGGGSSTPTGTLSLSITDKPLLDGNVTEVNIAVIGIEYHHKGNWIKADDFNATTFNLLDLQNGKSLHLGDMILPAGHYTQIRFVLAAPVKESDVKSNPDCNITFENNTSVPLFVPSGGQSGYKAIGEFDIFADAKVAVTADFDVQKSIVVTGSGKYLLKPVIRLVVTELSGWISGRVVDVAEYNATDSLVVYAYGEFPYVSGDENENSDEIRFSHAVSSGDVNMSDGNFTLSFLGERVYDLVTALYDEGNFSKVVDVEMGVGVYRGMETPVDLNTSDYTSN